MDNNLIITSKKYHGDSGVISVRLPGDLISVLDSIASETGRTRNDVIQKCIEFSINKIEIK